MTLVIGEGLLRHQLLHVATCSTQLRQVLMTSPEPDSWRAASTGAMRVCRALRALMAAELVAATALERGPRLVPAREAASYRDRCAHC
jgi:hypothetical protein